MPIWAVLYLLAITIFLLYGAWANWRERPKGRIFADSLGDAVLMYLFCAYWYPGLLTNLHIIAIALLVSSLLWTAYSSWSVYRKMTESGMGIERPKACRVCIAIVIILFELIVGGPLYYWATISVLFSKHAGA